MSRVERMIAEKQDFPTFLRVYLEEFAQIHKPETVRPSYDRGIAEEESKLGVIEEAIRAEGVLTVAARLYGEAIREGRERMEEVKRQAAIVAAMKRQVEVWAPVIDPRGIKQAMLGELNHGPCERLIAIHQEMLSNLEATTPETYLDHIIREHAGMIARLRIGKIEEETRIEADNRWRTQMAEELKRLETVI